MPIIDASVYVALIKETESEHANAREWIREASAGNETLAAPTIFVAEVAAAISRGLGNRALARSVSDHLAESGLIELLPVTEALAGRAASISADHKIRGCDAIYVALAERLDDHLVSLDNQQLDRGAAVVETRRPRKNS